MRSSWRGRNGLLARSLRRYVLWSTVAIPVTPVLTPRRPEPFRQYRSPPTRNRVERSPQHQPGRIHARWNLLPFWVLTQQFAIQVEREIQKQIQKLSCQIVQGRIAEVCQPDNAPTPSEAAWASLSQCFQKVLATPRTEPVPPLEQPGGQTKGKSPQVFTGRPICWNQPAPT